MQKVTDCKTWMKLDAHYRMLSQLSLRQLFAESPERFNHFSLEAAGIFIDFSKNWITDQSVDLLCALAIEQGLPQAIQALFSGEKINFSECRAASHVALRSPIQSSFMIDGKNVVDDVQCELQKMAHIAEQLEKKALKGLNGKTIDTILHIGIGGSDLGSALYYRAMEKYPKNAVCYFLTEFDFAVIQAKLALCNPDTTIVVVASKSFKTQETLTIFESVKSWMGAEKVSSQCYAVTANTDIANTRGFSQDRILKIWDWVGGRYSVWSAVNFSMVLVYGIDHFSKFLHGAHQMDLHFQQAPLKNNLPVMMGLLSVWYNNFFHAHTQAIVPYSARLAIMPAYLQQLHMESLGKTVTIHGEKINYATGRVIWGDIGPNSQHSFHQLLMQGSHMIPVDFILPLKDGELNDYDLKRAAYCLSQSQTLMQGFEATNTVQAIDGNRPSTTILIDEMTPETLGALMALYEHKVFVQSVIWHINAFDQWGVERGKQISDVLMQSMTSEIVTEQFDASTAGLLERITRRFQS